MSSQNRYHGLYFIRKKMCFIKVKQVGSKHSCALLPVPQMPRLQTWAPSFTGIFFLNIHGSYLLILYIYSYMWYPHLHVCIRAFQIPQNWSYNHFWDTWCSGLNENVPHRLWHPNSQSPVGLRSLEDVTLLEGVWCRGLVLVPCSVHSLFPTYGSQCELLAVPPTMPHACCHAPQYMAYFLCTEIQTLVFMVIQ